MSASSANSGGRASSANSGGRGLRPPDDNAIRDLVRLALAEDVGAGDVTTRAWIVRPYGAPVTTTPIGAALS